MRVNKQLKPVRKEVKVLVFKRKSKHVFSPKTCEIKVKHGAMKLTLRSFRYFSNLIKCHNCSTTVGTTSIRLESVQSRQKNVYRRINRLEPSSAFLVPRRNHVKNKLVAGAGPELFAALGETVIYASFDALGSSEIVSIQMTKLKLMPLRFE